VPEVDDQCAGAREERHRARGGRCRAVVGRREELVEPQVAEVARQPLDLPEAVVEKRGVAVESLELVGRLHTVGPQRPRLGAEVQAEVLVVARRPQMTGQDGREQGAVGDRGVLAAASPRRDSSTTRAGSLARVDGRARGRFAKAGPQGPGRDAEVVERPFREKEAVVVRNVLKRWRARRERRRSLRKDRYWRDRDRQVEDAARLEPWTKAPGGGDGGASG
jgi:hypothetical protein